MCLGEVVFVFPSSVDLVIKKFRAGIRDPELLKYIPRF